MAKATSVDKSRSESAQLEDVAGLLEQSTAVIGLVCESLDDADSPRIKNLAEALRAARSLIHTATARLDNAIEGNGNV